MSTVIGVRLKKAGRLHFFDADDTDISTGDYVLIDTVRGLECAKVVVGPRELPISENPESSVPQIRKIYRKATARDLQRLEENKREEKKAFVACKQMIKEHGLPMKLIDVSFTFDVNKIIFFFTAEGRVDFRDLVKDLAYYFRTRIELRQVGVRDEAKKLGGLGCCGRPLCCASFLGEFIPVTIQMAKTQNLSLNPTKISGICGRLMCCLKFEEDFYCENCPNQSEQQQIFQPRRGNRVVIEDGEGKVITVNPIKKTATVLLNDNKTVVADWENILPIQEEEATAIENLPEEPVREVEPQKKPRPVHGKFERPNKEGGNKNFQAGFYNRSNNRGEKIPRPRNDNSHRNRPKDFRK